jgi:hypothetical protein
MGFEEARWALEFLAWEGPKSGELREMAAEDAAFANTTEALRREQQRRHLT